MVSYSANPACPYTFAYTASGVQATVIQNNSQETADWLIDSVLQPPIFRLRSDKVVAVLPNQSPYHLLALSGREHPQ